MEFRRMKIQFVCTEDNGDEDEVLTSKEVMVLHSVMFSLEVLYVLYLTNHKLTGPCSCGEAAACTEDEGEVLQQQEVNSSCCQLLEYNAFCKILAILDKTTPACYFPGCIDYAASRPVDISWRDN